MAQWLERATDYRVVAGSNPAEAVWKLWQIKSNQIKSNQIKSAHHRDIFAIIAPVFRTCAIALVYSVAE